MPLRGHLKPIKKKIKKANYRSRGGFSAPKQGRLNMKKVGRGARSFNHKTDTSPIEGRKKPKEKIRER